MIRLAATMRCPTVLTVGSNFLVEALEPRDTLTGAAVTLDSIAVDIRDALGELVAAYVGRGDRARPLCRVCAIWRAARGRRDLRRVCHDHRDSQRRDAPTDDLAAGARGGLRRNHTSMMVLRG